MEYEKCLVELDEILNYLADEELEKIPLKIRNAIKENKDKHYIWHYDESKELNAQNINRKTIAMLSYLNMEYLLTKEQKELMIQIHKTNEQNEEKEKQEKYNVNNILKRATIKDTTEEISIADTKCEKWYSKIFLFIKKYFHKI